MEATIKLLVVDDHDFSRLALKLVLQRAGDIDVVAEATNGRSACQAAMIHAPDVVLMDIVMPLMDGIDATKEIKSKLPATRVLMFTAHANELEVFAALAAGADGYALKSVDSKILATAVRSVASGAAWLDPSIAGVVLRAIRPAAAAYLKEKPLLTEREGQVLSHVVAGASNVEIASALNISVDTTKTHLRHIMQKLSVSDRTRAAVEAIKRGLL